MSIIFLQGGGLSREQFGQPPHRGARRAWFLRRWFSAFGRDRRGRSAGDRD